ncbi:hypothetical protein ACH4T9_05270 [Micromonospora sp. NPDC020750]|uniref:hypothetical protein n=1 Tax=unclassified Micromonospora TaxID=2617518 RepID=UPI0037981436
MSTVVSTVRAAAFPFAVAGNSSRVSTTLSPAAQPGLWYAREYRSGSLVTTPVLRSTTAAKAPALSRFSLLANCRGA